MNQAVTLDRIAVDSKIHFGQPCIKGTRIPVYCVLELVRDGRSFDEIIRDHYPDIMKEDIQASIRWRHPATP
jgi:uncharacterized protein (DUF433 family)